jgi:hypothetical protein
MAQIWRLSFSMELCKGNGPELADPINGWPQVG